MQNSSENRCMKTCFPIVTGTIILSGMIIVYVNNLNLLNNTDQYLVYNLQSVSLNLYEIDNITSFDSNYKYLVKYQSQNCQYNINTNNITNINQYIDMYQYNINEFNDNRPKYYCIFENVFKVLNNQWETYYTINILGITTFVLFGFIIIITIICHFCGCKSSLQRY